MGSIVMLDFVRWIVQGRVLLVQFSGILSLEDVNQMNIRAAVLMEEALPPHVDVIANGTFVTQFDRNLVNIRNLRGSLGKHPLVNWHIIVDPDPNPAMQFLGSMVFKLLGARYRVMDTIESALAFLQATEPQPLIRTDLGE
jgi:hypothetical protein